MFRMRLNYRWLKNAKTLEPLLRIAAVIQLLGHAHFHVVGKIWLKRNPDHQIA